jgi:subtilase family serine protease
MLLRHTLCRRLAISPALLAAFLVATAAIAVHAQVPQSGSAALSAIHPVAQQDRIPAHPDFAPLTQLNHQLPGWVHGRAQSSARAIDLSTTMRASVVLQRDPAVEAAFIQLLADQQTPGSPLYHQWLTPQQVGTLYGPTAHDLAALTDWLTSQGVKVDSVAPSGVIVHISGTVAAVGNAFHTSFAMFSPDEGFTAAPRFSAISEPYIPSALTPLVRSIQGLGELEFRPLNQARVVQGTQHPSGDRVPSAGSSTGAHPQVTLSDGSHFVTPGDFAIIFDINSVHNGGNTGAKIGGKAQRVAVIGESRVSATDISEYENLTGLPAVTPTVVIPTGSTDPGTTGTGLQDEATLDVDRVIATAPGAGVDLVIAKVVGNTGGIFDAAQYNIDTLLDPVMTISFGGCESSNGPSAAQYVDTLAQSAVAEGITILVSSGDSGAAGCDASFVAPPASQVASINFICSSSYVTCVGGTEFNDTNASAYWSSSNSSTFVSALSYIPEGAWNEPGPNSASPVYAPAASGGGVSLDIARPSWQTGTGVPSGSFRFVPDVSFPAASHDGYFACLAYAKGDCTVQSNGSFSFIIFSGTSAAAPGMAGVVALINTKTGSAAGNINPMLYALAASTPSAFHDITIASSGVTGCAATTPSLCNNSTPAASSLTGGLSGFLLTTGFDEVTGLGSMDVATLVANATAPTTGGGGTGGFTLSAAPTTLAATPTASTNLTPVVGTVTSTITATSNNSFNGPIALSCAITPTAVVAPTCAVSLASITPAANASATATLTITFQGSANTCSPSTRATPIHAAYFGPAALAFLLLLLPFRKRKSMRGLACLVLLVTGLVSLSGCGGSSTNSSPACSNVVVGGTTAGAYTVTVTGKSGTITQSTPVALTIN